MKIKLISEILNPAGFCEPLFNALVPNVDNYKVLLMQPNGQIEVDDEGVRNKGQDLAKLQFGQFLEDALKTQADLVVTPEYSMPWDVLVNTIKAGIAPTKGKLWVLGCEGIKYSKIDLLKNELASFATVLNEALPSEAPLFVSPLAYVFKAPRVNSNGEEGIVVLLQFKTHPMGDPSNFEINGMQKGTYVYQFGGNGQNVRLVSLICSDAFAFEDRHAMEIYDRGLIIHIQLNREPRHEQFLGCRQRLLGFSGDETEVLCLNWARDVHLWNGTKEDNWQNVAGSAWYLKSNEYDCGDVNLIDNHRRGFYYTRHQTLHAHALFFNFMPATYLIETTKVYHVGVAGPISRRRGPQLIKTSIWDDSLARWTEQERADDGFSAIVVESNNAKEEIKQIADSNPLEAERILALCAGKITDAENWYDVQKLDSCVIDTSEVICRLTFCQDTDENACGFRIARLKRCARLWDILKSDFMLNPAIADLKDGFHFEWSQEFPHQNVISISGKRATAIYMGEEISDSQVEATARKAAEFLHRACKDPDESHSARQRLGVWYRGNDGEMKLYGPDRFIKYDNTGDTSEFDIGRES